MLRVQNVKKKSKSTFKIWRNLGYSTDFTDTWKFNMIAYDYSKLF